MFQCPDEMEVTEETIALRKKLQLDQRLYSLVINMVIRVVYIGFLALLSTHNTITISNMENEHLLSSVNNSFQVRI